MGAMLAPLFVLSMAAAADSSYAATLQATLQKNAASWQPQASKALGDSKESSAAVALEINVGTDGGVRSMRLASSSGKNRLDDLAQTLVLETEPFAPPPVALNANTLTGEVPCVVRIALVGSSKKRSAETTVACVGAGQMLGTSAGLPANATDAAARLMQGWAKEEAGDLANATTSYKEAVNAAPHWDLPARALGLALVHNKRAGEAVPFLRLYVAGRSGAPDAAAYAREIKRFEEQQAARLAEAKKPRSRLSQQDIAMGVRKGYALLEPCLREARSKRLLAVGVDTLQFSWAVSNDGKVHNPHLDGPSSLLLTAHAECLEGALESWQFPPYTEGSDISVKGVPIKVRGSPAQVPAATASLDSTHPGAAPVAAPPAASEVLDEPTFSTCERTADDIGGFIRNHLDKVQVCLQSERQRDPSAAMPDKLPVSFVVDVDGSVRNIKLSHRFYRTGALADCMGTALLGTMGPATGADCPAEFNLDLHRLLGQ